MKTKRVLERAKVVEESERLKQGIFADCFDDFPNDGDSLNTPRRKSRPAGGAVYAALVEFWRGRSPFAHAKTITEETCAA
jgi:hypothetical protein